MPKVWPVEFKLLNGWSLQLFSWSIDISICAIQKNIRKAVASPGLSITYLYYEVNYSQYRYEY